MFTHSSPHTSNRPSRKPFAIKAVAVLGTAFALAGCPSVQMPEIQNFSANIGPAPNLQPAQLPTFFPGDKYYYANGARDQVVSTDGEMVNMISRSGRKRTYFRNFALPTPYVEGSTKHFYKNTDTSVTALWPLQVGNEVAFTTKGRSISKDSSQISDYTQKWKCNVNGTERIRVMAGEFDTFRVECKRFSSTWKWWETTTYYYAPDVGTYVLRRQFHKKNGESVRQLTAVRPSLHDLSDDTRRNIIRTWQMALEYKESGQIASWTDQAAGVSVQVEPLTVFKADSGLFCRTYKQYLTRQGNTRIYRGVACRTDKLKWRTPARI